MRDFPQGNQCSPFCLLLLSFGRYVASFVLRWWNFFGSAEQWRESSRRAIRKLSLESSTFTGRIEEKKSRRRPGIKYLTSLSTWAAEHAPEGQKGSLKEQGTTAF